MGQALGHLYGYSDWSFLRREATYNLRASYTTVGGAGALQATFTRGSTIVDWVAPPDTTPYGHTILANNRQFRVANVLSAGSCQIDAPWFDADGIYAVEVLNHEIALPRGTKSVLKVMLNQSNTPLRQYSDTPQEMREWNLRSRGQPFYYAVSRREPLPSPIAAPTLAIGGAGITGAYFYWQTYWDPVTGAESNLSPQSAVVNPADDTVTFTPATRADFYYKAYRSRASGTVPYFLQERLSATATILDARADVVLGLPATAEASSLYLSFHPIPNAVYQALVVVSIVPPLPQAADDEPWIPEEDIPVLLDGAEYYMLTSTEEHQRAGAVQGMFKAGLDRMVARDKLDRAHLILVGGRDRGPYRSSFRAISVTP